MIGQIYSILSLAALTASAADVTILTVDPFGRPIQDCHVVDFRADSKEGATPLQYSNRFSALTGKRIPFGEYNAIIACGQAEAHKQIIVDHFDQFEVTTVSGRHMIGDHVKAKISIKLQSPTLANEIWWISLIGLYNGKTYTDHFAKVKGGATIVDPVPGSYLVTVSSTAGYSCVQEVDFVESTSAWTFHSANCSFEFDRFAHLVQDQDKRNHKQGGWYDQMRADKDMLRRSINDALRKK